MKKIIIFSLFLTLFLQACISIKKSDLRKPERKIIQIDDCKISSTGAVYMKILGFMKADFMPASVKIQTDSLLLYIDPIIVEDTIVADYIFITHNHLDHFSKNDINKISDKNTLIVAPKTVTKKLKNKKTKTVSIGDKYIFKKFNVEVVESYNINSSLHKKGNKFVGYVITYNATRIYIAGDTDFIPEMEELKNITVAIIPIGEQKTAMNPQTASKAANIIKPDIVIPIHYELELNREKDFCKLVDKNIEVKFFR